MRLTRRVGLESRTIVGIRIRRERIAGRERVGNRVIERGFPIPPLFLVGVLMWRPLYVHDGPRQLRGYRRATPPCLCEDEPRLIFQTGGVDMMLDWDGYRQELLKRIGDLGRMTPATVRGYRELSDAGNKTAHLDAKTRELIAIAVGVTRQCDGCITTHVHAARKQGATAEEIAEALGVAIAVNAGAALVFSARAMDAVLATPAAQG